MLSLIADNGLWDDTFFLRLVSLRNSDLWIALGYRCKFHKISHYQQISTENSDWINWWYFGINYLRKALESFTCLRLQTNDILLNLLNEYSIHTGEKHLILCLCVYKYDSCLLSKTVNMFYISLCQRQNFPSALHMWTIHIRVLIWCI